MYNYIVIDYSVIDMANKDHSLDKKIIDSALKEFLKEGYRDASLRVIARDANVTVGAIRTRYKTKDELFCSLLHPLTTQIEALFITSKVDYYQSSPLPIIEQIKLAMKRESEEIFNLLFSYYDEAILLLCKSGGSSMEHYFDEVVQRKSDESILFFQEKGEQIDSNILNLLISLQFYSYKKIIGDGYKKAEAKEYLSTLMSYHFFGWVEVLSKGEEEL